MKRITKKQKGKQKNKYFCLPFLFCKRMDYKILKKN